jgi:hypothetical protein
MRDLGHGFPARPPVPQAFFGRNVAASINPGFFGKMFPTLPGLQATEDKLEKLANAMLDAGADSSGDNPKIPAGFTYLGQFVDHDITLDLTSLSEKIEDPLQIENFRTPGLDLDSVYGLGPGPHSHFFARDPVTFAPGPRFLIGTANPAINELQQPTPALPNDLVRSRQGLALIGDHRNDENLIVAQTHLALLKFHNKVVDRLAAQGVPAGQLFEKARETVRWHYQWLALHDFVARLVEPGLVKTILTEGRKFYRFKTRPFMPVEFAVAAYRLGHSMVREDYNYNRVFRPQGGLANATLRLLFDFSGLSGRIVGDTVPPQIPLPQPVLPSNWVIDWRRFFDFKTPPGGPTGLSLNLARKFDPFITRQLHTLPGFPPGREANLAFRNLRRGVQQGLPSGQDVAELMKKKIKFNPLTPAEIAQGSDGQVARQLGFDKKTPLWFYILKEAQVRGKGEYLGPVGSRIVAEVFIGLLQGDKQSFLSQKNWKPSLPAKTAGTFLMTDLLQFVGDISPLEGITTVNTL